MFKEFKYASAESIATGLLAEFEPKFGRESSQVCEVLDLLVDALWKSGRYMEPETMRLAERAVEARENVFSRDDPSLVMGLQHLGVLNKLRGRYETARPLYERALAIGEKNFGPESPKIIESLNFLGTLLRTESDYAAAKPLLERALAIAEKNYAPDNPRMPGRLGNLAHVLADAGDYESARPLYERALAIAERLYPDDAAIAIWLNNLADLLRATGDPQGARPLLERALAIREKATGPDDPFVVESLDALGSLLADLGGTQAARRLHVQALATAEKVLGPEHPSLPRTLGNLAHLDYMSGEMDSSLALYRRALRITEKALGPDHPDVAGVLVPLAIVLAAAGDHRAAVDAALRAEDLGRTHLHRTIRTLPERQALRFASVRTSGLDLAVSLLGESRVLDPLNVRRVCDAVIRSRALVLTEMASRHRALGAGDATGLADSYVAAEQRLANVLVAGPGGDVERYQALRKDARREAEAAETALAEKSATFRDEESRFHIGLEQVCAALPRRSALVAYVRYDDRLQIAGGARRPTGIPSYMAFALVQGRKTPGVVPLGRASRIDSLVQTWRVEAGTRPRGNPEGQDEARCRAAGADLRRVVWDPIAAHLSSAQQVFLVPDGSLQLVNFSALPVGDDKFLVDGGPVLHDLSAERDVVRPARRTPGQGLLALGDPDYDRADAAPVLAQTTPAGTEDASSLPVTYRGAGPPCAGFETLRWPPLPGTARELDEIAELWKRETRAVSEMLELRGPRATEAAFKHQAPGRRMVHLATHGFFVTQDCVPPAGHGRGMSPVESESQPGARPQPPQNPLVLSGLVLAGANRHQVSEDGDGVLTAEEIASLDLSGVQWAVLSACDTGVGAVRAGEGVFGLRRAFEVAGAGTLIMSLWSVDDEAARRWMQALYEARLLKRLGTAVSCRDASRTVLAQRRSARESTHPFFWAGFVAAGDWR